MAAAYMFLQCGRKKGTYHTRMTVSRIIDVVSHMISKHADNFIKFPSDNVGKIDIMQKYYQVSKFPNKISWDVLMVNISLYTKCFNSENVKGVSDADLKFTKVVAKWPRHSCVLTNATLCSLILSNILIQYIRMKNLRHRLVHFMLRLKTYLSST